MDTSNNQTIKGYELRARIGAGGFGAVYRAYQTTVGREVAVKIILPGLANQPEFIRRFEGEAQLVARLEHPHITPLYDYWRDTAGAYLVMRWLRGGSLRDALENGPFELRAAALLLDQVAGALSLAHRNGVIHRDIKPGNILLDEDDNAYLTDFGIAKDLNLPGNNTQQDAIVGSLDYISPEQARSEPVTARTDIYSLGVTMFEVITGHHPFGNISPIERLYKHINDPLPQLTILEPKLQAEVNRVIQKATAKNPEHRYPDALTFAADFREAAGMNRLSTTVVELLTQREHEILQLMIEGLSNKDIAQRLTVTVGTVKWYVNQIFSKMGVRSRVQAIVRARELNLIVKPGEAPSAAPIPTEDFHPENPYKGLRAFKSADYQDFFGREKVTAKLVQRMGDAGDYHRFLVAVGPSGSGKSSLVKAGLIPALWRGDLPRSEKWFVVEMLPGSHPLDELEIALTKVAANQSPNMREHLERDSRGLLRIAQLILPNDDSELVLVIDQFEEVFTLVEDEAARSHFLDLLYSAVTELRSRVRVIVTLRADFYDRPLHYPQFGELVRTRLETIMPLSAEELERAITGPAQRVGVAFEPGLVAGIIGDVNYQPGALPLLQYALTELFEQRRGRLLTREAYQALGGAIGALAKRTEEVYLSLDETGQKAAQQMFLRLVTLGEGVEDTRRRTSRAELQAAADADMMDDVIDAFASYRLLSLDTDPGTRTPIVEVAHEALLREWERLREWLNDSRDEIKLQRQVSSLAEEWQYSKRDASFLARGNRLAQFEAWAKDTELALTGAERAFLEASSAQHAQEQQAEAEWKAREIRLEHRSRNFMRGLVAVLIVAALVGVGLAALAINQSRIAQRNAALADRNAAESQNVALVAGSQAALATGNTDLAIALALNAVTLNSTSAPAQVALGQAAYAPGTIRRFIGHTDEVSDVAFRPDGHTAISIANDGIMIVWDVATGAMIRNFPSGHTGKYFRMSLSPDGRTTLSGGTDGLVILDDPATGKIIRRFEGHTGTVEQVSFSPDGQMALSASDDKTLILWDVATGAIIRRFTGHMAAVVGVAFSGDGRTALSASDDQTLILWDVATGTQLRQFTGAYPASYVEIRPDGRYAVTGSHENTVILMWDLSTGQVIRHLKGHTGPVTGIKYSPDGKYILSGSDDGSMILWDAESGDFVRRLGKHDNSVKGVAFSPDGRYALSASFDHTLRLWDLDEGYIIRRYAGHNNWIFALQISRDGRTALTASWDGTAKLWDVQTGQELRHLTGTGQLGGASFSPDGHTALISSADSSILWNVDSGEVVKRFAVPQSNESFAILSPDGRTFLTSFWSDNSVWLWDVATGKVIRRLVGHTANVIGMAFSPDGSMVLTGDSGGGIILWDVATGQLIRHFVGQNDLVGAAEFSKDGRTALSWGAVNGSNLWDVASGTILRHFDGGEIFSPDERTVFGAAGSALGPNVAVLVDVATGTVIRRYSGFGTLVIASSFTLDGKSVLVGFQDGSLELWRIDSPDELIAWIHASRYVAELSCDQRILYKLTATCDANAATPTATPYPTVPLTVVTDSP